MGSLETTADEERDATEWKRRSPARSVLLPPYLTPGRGLLGTRQIGSREGKTNLGVDDAMPRGWPMEAVRREAKLEQSDDDGVAICPPLSIYPLSRPRSHQLSRLLCCLLVARPVLLREPKRFGPSISHYIYSDVTVTISDSKDQKYI
jgi:hypothetical protein